MYKHTVLTLPQHKNLSYRCVFVTMQFNFLHQQETNHLQRQKTIHVFLSSHPPNYAK